jgi:hypothetical protein
MRIIVLVLPNILAWLHKASLPGHPEAVMTLLETYQSSLGAQDSSYSLPAAENWDA